MDLMTERLSSLFLPRARPLSDLDRLIAAAGAAHVAARRGLALAVAEEEREGARRAALIDRAADLESRALEAIVAGREDLATRAAHAIAAIETEVAASEAAAARFAAEVSAARREVDSQRRRLAELDRGRRLAKVGAALHATGPEPGGMPLIARAEAALAALEVAQAGDEAVRKEFGAPAGTLADDMVDDMAEAGFGRPTRTLPNQVLARLRARADLLALPARSHHD